MANGSIGDMRDLVDMDHAATTRLCDDARAAMEPFLSGGESGVRHGNPSGSHAIARDAQRALDEAREVLAGCIGCSPGEVVFTSGGTEADNQAVSGGMPPRAGVPVCSAVEHPAVLEPTLALGGAIVAVDSLGRLDQDSLAEVLDDLGSEVSVVSVMTANNELGTLNDVGSVSDLVRARVPAAVLHTDAVQAAPWLDLRSCTAGADLVSISAHKFGGPKGVGALVVRRSDAVAPLLLGGHQERDRRGGTHNVAGIVAMAAALAATSAAREATGVRVAALRDRLADAASALPGVTETVGPVRRVALGEPGDRRHLLPGHCHLLIEDASSEELLLLLEGQGVCASAASSCASGAVGVSHVLGAIGVVSSVATLRLTLGVESTDGDVDRTLGALGNAITRARGARIAS